MKLVLIGMHSNAGAIIILIIKIMSKRVLNMGKCQDAIYDAAKQVEEEIISFMTKNGIDYLNLQPHMTKNYKVLAIIYEEDTGDYVEVEIVGLHICDDDDSLYLLLQSKFDNVNIQWSTADIIKSWEESHGLDENWEPLFFGNINCVATAYNLCDALRYIDFSNQI